MTDSFEQLVEKYKKEMMKYLPADASVTEQAKASSPQPSASEVPSAVKDNPPANIEPFPPQIIPAPDSFDPVYCGENLTDSGSLRVILSAARQSIPLADGHISVSCKTKSGETLHYILITDQDGRSPLISLPAPDRSLAQQPQTDPPYALYDIRIDRDGYVSVLVKNAQVFGGITSIIPVNMTPSVRFAESETVTLTEHNLSEGDA